MTHEWDETTPDDNEVLSLGAWRIREKKRALQERQNECMVWGVGDEDGEHKKLIIHEGTEDGLNTRKVDDVTECHYDAIQITDQGRVTPSSGKKRDVEYWSDYWASEEVWIYEDWSPIVYLNCDAFEDSIIQCFALVYDMSTILNNNHLRLHVSSKSGVESIAFFDHRGGRWSSIMLQCLFKARYSLSGTKIWLEGKQGTYAGAGINTTYSGISMFAWDMGNEI